MCFCQGPEYEAGDFVVRLCRAVLKPGDEVKGLMLDVEYTPPSSIQDAHSALEASPLSLKYGHFTNCDYKACVQHLTQAMLALSAFRFPIEDVLEDESNLNRFNECCTNTVGCCCAGFHESLA